MVREKLKKPFCIMAAILLMLLNSGYTYPDGSPYLILDTNAGIFTVHFTTNSPEQLIYDDQNYQLINTGSSTIYGYTTYNGSDVRINFPTYDTPYISISYQNNIYLTQIEITDNFKVKLYTDFSSDMTTYIGIIIMFLLFFILFKR